MDEVVTETLPAPGKQRELIAALRQLLIKGDFDITKVSEHGFIAVFPVIQSLRHNPFEGISSVKVSATEDGVNVQSDFSGLRKARNFLFIFIPAHLLFLTSILSGAAHEFVGWPLLLIPIWFALLPLLLPVKRRRAHNALHRLLANAQAQAHFTEGAKE